MTLPTDYVDGDVLTAADVNAITTAVNAISPLLSKFAYASFDGEYATNSTSFTNTSVSLEYTPVNASNQVIVEATFQAGMAGADMNLATRTATFQLYDSTNAYVVDEKLINFAQEAASDDPTAFNIPVVLRGRTTTNSTVARTYVVRQRSSSGSMFVGVGATSPYRSIITVQEYLP
jgi:hypothetical protein